MVLLEVAYNQFRANTQIICTTYILLFHFSYVWSALFKDMLQHEGV